VEWLPTQATSTALSDEAFVKMVVAAKHSTTAPMQSNFRVMCILSIRDEVGRQGYITGTNAEQGFIGGSICAERSAAVQLRLLHQNCSVQKIYLCSDLPGKDHLSPGVLCREFLLAQPQIAPDCPVVMVSTGDSSTTTTSLAELYPHSCLYGKVPKGELLDWGRAFRAKAGAPEVYLTPDQRRLHAQALEATAWDNKDEIHPVRLAAGVLFADGSMHFAAQAKALEYGNTLDPVSLLAPVLLQYRTRGVHPVAILQVDQHGIMHAPFAPARSFLFENDFDEAAIFVHDPQGKVCSLRVEQLVPDAPRHIF